MPQTVLIVLLAVLVVVVPVIACYILSGDPGRQDRAFRVLRMLFRVVRILVLRK